MSVFDVRHQPRAQRIIQRALASGRLPHAYLFHGPDGVGKEMAAERLARILLCAQPRTIQKSERETEGLGGDVNPVRDACGECRDCVLVQAATHPDLHLVYRELHKHHPDSTVRNRVARDIGVDVIRHFVIDAVGVKPVRSQAKVFIIREADRITASAQNALLKSLEEPPEGTFLILLASALDRLLPTTKSRCQPVPFGPLSTEFVAERLAALVPDLAPEQCSLYAALAQGSLGTAVRFAEDQLDTYNERITDALGDLVSAAPVAVAKGWLEDAKTLGARFRERDPGISDTEAQRRGLKTLFALVGAWFKDALRMAVGEGGAVTSAGSVERLASLNIAPADAGWGIRAVVEAERDLDRNASTQLAVEALVIRLSRIVRAK
ncbi:MAG: DNA polymerase III subunit delta' [bacterium]|nr:DNA polymerase III subunit delta' [bacterium]